MNVSLEAESDGAARPTLVLSSVSKTYPGMRALDRVSLTIGQGRFHALLGGNGSGKSTLIKVLAGVVHGDGGGTITVDGVSIGDGANSPEWAQKNGLSFVHQDLGLFEDLSVAENLFVGVDFPNVAGVISWRRIYRDAEQLLDRFGLKVSPRAATSSLRPSEKTLVAVARALRGRENQRQGVLVLDEPTARLPTSEAGALIEALSRLCTKGQSILYVTHRLEEVLRAAAAVTILRDGRVVASKVARGLTKPDLVGLIAGREFGAIYPDRRAVRGAKPVLEVRNLTGGQARSLDFDVFPGEVLGIAGLIGSGRSSLLKMLFGLLPYTSGSVVLNGVRLPAGVAAAVAAGMAFVPEDRVGDAAFGDLSVVSNLSAAHPKLFQRAGLYDETREKRDAASVIGRLRIRLPSSDAPLLSLSGGNQQKVILGRWLRQGTSLLLLDEPTQGVDVGARADIYLEISKAREAGLGVVMVSSDDDEVLGLADRVMVLNRGRVVAAATWPNLDASWLSHHSHTPSAIDGEAGPDGRQRPPRSKAGVSNEQVAS